MSAPVDAATSTFLGAAANDLRRQVGRVGIVERITAETEGDGVTLIASMRVGTGRIEVRGSGDSLLTAYASLTRTTAEAMLAAAFRELIAT